MNTENISVDASFGHRIMDKLGRIVSASKETNFIYRMMNLFLILGKRQPTTSNEELIWQS
jgi:hypothetical protein